MRAMGRVGIGLALTALVVTVSGSRVDAQCGAAAAPVRAVADAYVKAVLAADVQAVMALYAEDAVEMPPDLPMIKGRAAIEAYYKKDFAEMAGKSMKISKFSITHLDAAMHGDAAHDVGTYTQTLTGGPKPMTQTGKFAVLLKRQGGAWKVAYAIYNRDAAPPMEH
jgi:uncharacterized protein (TIGR02246 family)